MRLHGLAYYAGLLQQEMTAAYQQIDVGGVIYLLLFNPFTVAGSSAASLGMEDGDGSAICPKLRTESADPLSAGGEVPFCSF